MNKYSYSVKPGINVDLSKIATDDTGPFKTKHDAAGPTAENLSALRNLQEVLYANSSRAVLIVIQAMDTGGKDGAIDHVFSGVNPQGCSVTSFKQPSHLELAHDFLWRVHAAAPDRGMIGIFNRSHYESVLVERVHSLVPKEVWQERYQHINNFERLLSDEGTVIVKFFLHISKKEQKKRLQARLDDPDKTWKFDPNDFVERKLWDRYQAAYADALEKCSTNHAPWYIVPADHKWFRNWVISQTLVRTLQDLKLKYPDPPPGVEKLRRS